MRITFCGAAQQVTGSMFLVQTDNGYSILVDCGLNYEPGMDFMANARFPFDPEEIDVLLLTHAHMDHSGNIPTLVNQGFKGAIFCTEPTAELISGLLMDSANIQLHKASAKGKWHKKKRTEAPRLYGHKQVMDALEQVITVHFDQSFELKPGIEFMFRRAGHILGAASIELTVEESGERKKIGFTGDLGRDLNPIIVAPEPMKALDYMVCESTYGARVHRQHNGAREVLMQHIEEACIRQRGKLIIPAFSVGRTQAILFSLHQLYLEGRLGDIRVFTDSPLGILSTHIHEKYKDYLNTEVLEFIRENGSPFSFPNLRVVEDAEDKLEMEFYHKSSIVVSSAGMMEGGRIQEHVAKNLQNPLCTILSAGYCTSGTLGAALLEGKKRITIKGREQEVYARIESMDVFSAHPDRNELLNYLKKTMALSHVKKIFLVHGDTENIHAFSDFLHTETQWPLHIAELGESVIL